MAFRTNLLGVYLALLGLCGCGGVMEPVKELEIVPAAKRSDTVATLRIPSGPVSPDTLKKTAEGLGYDVYRDRGDDENTYRISVGWNSEHTVFRSYMVTSREGYVKVIKADYAYPNIAPR